VTDGQTPMKMEQASNGLYSVAAVDADGRLAFNLIYCIFHIYIADIPKSATATQSYAQ